MLAKIWLLVRSERKAENFKNPAIFLWPAGTYCLNMAISEFFPWKSGNFGTKILCMSCTGLFFLGQVAKVQKKKNCITKVWGGQFYTGKCKFHTREWGAAKFLHARILPLKCRMTSNVGILFCKIPLLRVSPYSENLCFVISCHTGLPQYYAR
jgi:hypothetical protein